MWRLWKRSFLKKEVHVARTVFIHTNCYQTNGEKYYISRTDTLSSDAFFLKSEMMGEAQTVEQTNAIQQLPCWFIQDTNEYFITMNMFERARQAGTRA